MNIIHSVDSYLLRSLLRRCNYDVELVQYAQNVIESTLLERSMGLASVNDEFLTDDISKYRTAFQDSSMTDVVILPYLTPQTAMCLSSGHLRQLNKVLARMLEHQPFDVITIHDDFRCHANHANQLRLHYRELLAELADSTVLADILSQLHGVQGGYNKLSPNLSSLIRESQYAIC